MAGLRDLSPPCGYKKAILMQTNLLDEKIFMLWLISTEQNKNVIRDSTNIQFQRG